MGQFYTTSVQLDGWQPVGGALLPGRGGRALPNQSARDTSKSSRGAATAFRKDRNMGTATSESPRVLIADDQHSVVEALRLLLKTAGYQTESVLSPPAVLDALENDSFDALLLDLKGWICFPRSSSSTGIYPWW
jgi:hypothetical protein